MTVRSHGAVVPSLEAGPGSRLTACFAARRASGRAALVAYIVAGDPTAALTLPLLHALAGAGADILELGVPFSDPMADGPVIQRAAERAIANGVGLRRCLDIVSSFRRDDRSTPLVLMGYANPIERFGTQAFIDAAAAAGVDGVIVVDYPPQECAAFAAALRAAGLAPIFLLAPTSTDQRIEQVARAGAGFLYYVALKGITGARHLDIAAVAACLPRIRAHSSLPVAVGFGVRDGASARAVADVADAVVVGTRLVEAIEQAGPQGAQAAAARLISALRAAIDDHPLPAAQAVEESS